MVASMIVVLIKTNQPTPQTTANALHLLKHHSQKLLLRVAIYKQLSSFIQDHVNRFDLLLTRSSLTFLSAVSFFTTYFKVGKSEGSLENLKNKNKI